MSHLPRANTLQRLACAAVAAMITSVIGYSIDALARHCEEAGERLANAQPALVAYAAKR